MEIGRSATRPLTNRWQVVGGQADHQWTSGVSGGRTTSGQPACHWRLVDLWSNRWWISDRSPEVGRTTGGSLVCHWRPVDRQSDRQWTGDRSPEANRTTIGPVISRRRPIGQPVGQVISRQPDRWAVARGRPVDQQLMAGSKERDFLP